MGGRYSPDGRSRMRNSFWITAVILLTSASSIFAQNLLVNGNFEKGTNDQGEPVGWHSRITGVITLSEYKDPDKKKGLLYKHFRDGCGYDWGRIRPWPGLFCPQCGQMITTEESADWYVENYKRVSLGEGKTGQGVLLKMDTFVGENQGVRVCSDFMKAEKGAGYEIGVDIKGELSTQVFLECFQFMPEDKVASEWVSGLPEKVNPFKHTMKLKRTARLHIYPNVDGSKWTYYVDRDVMREEKQFDVMYVTLYGYGKAGEVSFDNAFVRKLTAAEVAAYKKENPVKEDRFRYYGTPKKSSRSGK